MFLRFVAFLLLCVSCLPCYSQTKSLAAVKAVASPKIDGNLDETAWATAPGVTDFIQNYPAYGQPATQRSTVKILYDNEAVYIGAYLFDDPNLIRNQLTSRDGEQRQDV
ncbi:MAG TPA: hypothetical protein VM010_04885, partial [Chitinophagaceae bacterium]|nr:hypothetical protein [Chitinophagaceae bacterium]